MEEEGEVEVEMRDVDGVVEGEGEGMSEKSGKKGEKEGMDVDEVG